MANPFIGEIRLFAGNFAPAGWFFCHGQLLSIAEYEALFTLIGTTYGGDGQNTFALPDLRGRVPVHQGSGFVIGQTGGAEQVTLTANQVPPHTHAVRASSGTATGSAPGGALLAATGAVGSYGSGSPDVAMAPGAVAPAGGGQPHPNMPPFLALNCIIAVFGLFPSPN